MTSPDGILCMGLTCFRRAILSASRVLPGSSGLQRHEDRQEEKWEYPRARAHGERTKSSKQANVVGADRKDARLKIGS
jgi:hypothetical protein